MVVFKGLPTDLFENLLFNTGNSLNSILLQDEVIAWEPILLKKPLYIHIAALIFTTLQINLNQTSLFIRGCSNFYQLLLRITQSLAI